MGRIIKLLVVLALAGGIGYGTYYYANKLYLAPKQQAAEEAAAPTPQPPPPPDPGTEPLQQAKDLKKEGKIEDARVTLEQLLINFPESRKIDEAKEILGEINADLFFSPTGEDKLRYTVRSGDSLNKIATKQKSSAELIMRCNNMESTMLQLGQELIIPQGQFSIFINSADKTVILYKDNRFFREYKATSGKVNTPASAISTKVSEKIAMKDSKRVTFDAKEFLGSSRWIRVASPGYDLYTDWQPTGETHNDMPKPASGLGLPPDLMEELHALVNRGTEVYVR